MNEKQIKQFEELCKKFTNQDHHRTRDPIYLVQTRYHEYTDEDHSPDGFWLINSQYGEAIGTFEFKDKISEILNEINEYMDIIMDDYSDVTNVSDLIDRLDYYGHKFEIAYFRYAYRTKFYTLFDEDAKAYMEYQGHNLDHPRIYVDTLGYGSDGFINELYILMEEVGNERSQ